MANPLSNDVIVGTYARGEARLLLTRHRGTQILTITLDRPCITLDAAGHRVLLDALALAPAAAAPAVPISGPGVPYAPFSGVPKIGGPR